jgi:hypothetical protein
MAKLSEAMEETHMEIKNYPEIMKADKIVSKINHKWDKTMARLERIPNGTKKNKRLYAKGMVLYNEVDTFNKTIYLIQKSVHSTANGGIPHFGGIAEVKEFIKHAHGGAI